MFEMLNDGQYGRLYDVLHPGQQAVITRDHFISCYQRAEPFPETEIDEIKEVFQEEVSPVDVGPTTATAITAEFTSRLGDDEMTDTDTFNQYDVEGRWVWALTDDAATAMKSGECPG